MNKIIKLNERKLHRIIEESIKRILTENSDINFRKSNYTFYDTCVNMDVEDLQNITHFDEYADNDYCIGDEYYNTDVFVIPYEDFISLVGANQPQPSKDEISYCGYNIYEDVLFAYTNDDIHWIYT